MGNVVELRRNKLFTLREARVILPIVQKITTEAVAHVGTIRRQLDHLDPEGEQRPQFQEALNQILQRWSLKIAKLGAEPKGFWLVDFDSGEGYFCWKYPEEDLGFFHPYETGLSGRTPIH